MNRSDNLKSVDVFKIEPTIGIGFKAFGFIGFSVRLVLLVLIILVLSIKIIPFIAAFYLAKKLSNSTYVNTVWFVNP